MADKVKLVPIDESPNPVFQGVDLAQEGTEKSVIQQGIIKDGKFIPLDEVNEG